MCVSMNSISHWYSNNSIHFHVMGANVARANAVWGYSRDLILFILPIMSSIGTIISRCAIRIWSKKNCLISHSASLSNNSTLYLLLRARFLRGSRDLLLRFHFSWIYINILTLRCKLSLLIEHSKSTWVLSREFHLWKLRILEILW